MFRRAYGLALMFATKVRPEIAEDRAALNPSRPSRPSVLPTRRNDAYEQA
jgi:hypothetical protein